MKRRLFLLVGLLCGLAALASAQVPKEVFEVNGLNFKVLADSKTVELTAREGGYKGTINVPAKVTHTGGKELTVTQIAPMACSENDELVEVHMAEGIQKIHAAAFANCDRLEKATIPSTVTLISYAAFYNAVSLKKAVVPAGVNAVLLQAFAGCKSLEAIELAGPNPKYKSIDGVFFVGDTELLFYPAGKKDKTYSIPEGVRFIWGDAFASSQYLEEVVLPSSLEEVESYAFYECSALKSVTIPARVTMLGEGVFVNCKSLTEIKVDFNNKKFKDIDGVLFTPKQTRLIAYPAGKPGDTYTIPETVRSIQVKAFSHNQHLVSVSIHKKVKYISDGAFFSAFSLKEIKVEEGNPYFKDIDGVLAKIATNELICYPAGKEATCYTSPQSLPVIYGGAFAGCKALQDLTFPLGVTIVAGWTFEECSNLKSVVFPSTLEGLGQSAFNACNALERIYLTSPKLVPLAGDLGLNSTATIFVPKGMGAAYMGDALWSQYKSQIKEMEGPALEIVPPSKTTIAVGDVLQLAVKKSPADSMHVRWESEAPTILSVDKDGKVKGLAIGKANVIATLEETGLEAKLEITVADKTSTPVEATATAPFAVAPNPAHSYVTVEGLTESTTAQIYALEGGLVRTLTLQPNARVDINDLAPGLYILKVNGHSIRILKK